MNHNQEEKRTVNRNRNDTDDRISMQVCKDPNSYFNIYSIFSRGRAKRGHEEIRNGRYF